MARAGKPAAEGEGRNYLRICRPWACKTNGRPTMPIARRFLCSRFQLYWAGQGPGYFVQHIAVARNQRRCRARRGWCEISPVTARPQLAPPSPRPFRPSCALNSPQPFHVHAQGHVHGGCAKIDSMCAGDLVLAGFRRDHCVGNEERAQQRELRDEQVHLLFRLRGSLLPVVLRCPSCLTSSLGRSCSRRC